MNQLWSLVLGIPPRVRAAVALVAGWLAFFPALIFSSQVMYERDIYLTDIPMRQYMVERLKSGQWPQWYPYEILGVPFAGTFVASPFHPQSLLHFLLSASTATKWRILLAFLFGLFGAYRLARRLRASRVAAVTGAYAFAFSGYCASLYDNPMFLVPLMTAPWMLAAAIRLTQRDDLRDVAFLGFWWSLLLLGGDAQLWAEGGVLAAALLTVSGWTPRLARRFSLGTALSAALVCGELLPGFALRNDSERALWEADVKHATEWALHPVRIPDLVFPHFTPYAYRIPFGAILNGRTDFFAFTLFLGAAILVLAVLGALREFPGRTVWIVTAILGFWLALGDYGVLLSVIWKFVPFISKFRYPEKYLGLTVLALIPLVSSGVDSVIVAGPRLFRWCLGIGGSLLAFGLFATPVALADWWMDVTGVNRKEMSQDMHRDIAHAWPHAIILAGATFVLLAVVIRFVQQRPQLLFLLPVFLFLELDHGNGGLIPTVSKAALDDVGSISRQVQARQQPNEPPVRVGAAQPDLRVYSLRPERLVRDLHLFLYSNDAGRGHVDTFDINSSAEEWRVMNTFYTRKAPPYDKSLKFFSVGLRVASELAPPVRGETVLGPSDHGFTLVSLAAKPRAYLANAHNVRDFDAALRRVRLGLPDDAVVWEGGPDLAAGGGTVQWKSAAPEQLDLDVNATGDSALVVADAFAIGWKATIDGKETPIYPVDGAARGVMVPSGHHQVSMSYRAPGLVAGIAITLLGLIATALVFVTGQRSRRRVWL
jgi:hypothetical protein